LNPLQEQLCIARFNSDGTIDTTFGDIDPTNSSIRKGYLVANLSSSFRQIIKTIALQPDGKIVSAGTCIDSNNQPRFCLVRIK